MHLHSRFLGRAELSAPWDIQVSQQKYATFHIVIQGNCWLEVDGLQEPVSIAGGDLVVIGQGHGHSLRSDRQTPVIMLEALLAKRSPDSDNVLSFGGGGIKATLACGDLYFEDWDNNPLLAALSPLILVRGKDGRAVEWLEATLQFMACETASNRLGAQTVITRLCDVMFIQAVRAFIANLPECEGSWLQALKDPSISLAIALIHRYVEKPWTVAKLAEQVCMSRSAFASRFKQLVGDAPLQYLTHTRMRKATSLLKNSQDNLTKIAQKVG